MRKITGLFTVLALMATQVATAQGIWQLANELPAAKAGFAALTAPPAVYKAQGAAITQALPASASSATVRMELPMPDGTLRSFSVRNTPIMPEKLAARYPKIQTYTAVATDDPAVVAKLEYTAFGFHAMVLDGGNTSFVDPIPGAEGYYTAHYRRDEVAGDRGAHACQVTAATMHQELPDALAWKTTADAAARWTNGYQLRTYRLALAANHYYCKAATGLVTPSLEQAFSKMVTSVNRINGIYERDLSVSMQFVENEDTLIWPTETGSKNGTDPFSLINTQAPACMTVNQQKCDTLIGNANYDLGHVFTTGAGGLAQVGYVCIAGTKAQSVTGFSTPVGDGFDVDYVSHEMGHQFGADHVFNNGRDGSCGGSNLVATSAYEPGSGSTIMAYAGICKPDNLQRHSDPYFHMESLRQINNLINTTADVCAQKTPTGNKPVGMAPFTASYTIPYLTPFELTAPTATDSVSSDAITYCWEQWNLGATGARLAETYTDGPIFRSYTPVAGTTRVFPKLEMILKGVLSNAGIDNASGEKAPDAARFLTFKVAVRNVKGGKGCFLVPDDTLHLDVINTGAGFKVTSQADSTLLVLGTSTQNVTWDVANTDQAPINAQNVNIYMSLDGGVSWPYNIGEYPNTGTATITLPNPDTTSSRVRIKVKGAGNVFFNINRYNFTVTHSDGTDTTIRLYPVPAHSTVKVSSGNKGLLQLQAFNAAGQLVWQGQTNGVTEIPVAHWGRGDYIMRMIDVKGGRTIRKFVVE